MRWHQLENPFNKGMSKRLVGFLDIISKHLNDDGLYAILSHSLSKNQAGNKLTKLEFEEEYLNTVAYMIYADNENKKAIELIYQKKENCWNLYDFSKQWQLEIPQKQAVTNDSTIILIPEESLEATERNNPELNKNEEQELITGENVQNVQAIEEKDSANDSNSSFVSRNQRKIIIGAGFIATLAALYLGNKIFTEKFERYNTILNKLSFKKNS